uniref:NUC domain-containing protein n=1 Tax=Loa loa TaxID=7209 RepID=A0A1I7VFF8_LOALO
MNVKLRKSTLFAWGIIIPLLTAAVIIFGSLYIIARTKFEKHKDTIQSPGHDDLSVCKRKFDVPPLLIISSDGFRDNYLDKNITPTIQRLINYGTHSKYMLPTFPSKTFPNHYTIATGLYPAWHGIIDNRFYDTRFKDFFKKNINQPGWYLGEPIWETAQKAGLMSAVFFWPGSNAVGKLPNYWIRYNSSVPLTHRIDTLIKWLNLPDGERPSVLQAYFEEPDYAGHRGGPNSQMVRTALILMDGIINYLINRLSQEGLMGCINFVLLSDHGMQSMDKEKSVVTANYLGPQFNDLFFPGVVARIKVNQTDHSFQNDEDNIVNNIISNLECRHGNNYLAYRKDLVPIRFHYAGSSRIGDIVIKGRPGVCIFQTDEEKESYKLLGDHGYDNRITSMRATFIAVGPDIAQNREINLLRIDAAPNNGTNGTLFNVLRSPPPIPITAVDRLSDQCIDKIIMKTCGFLHDCPFTNVTYQNCPTILHSSVSANYHFTGELCRLQLCDAIIHFDKKLRKTVMVEDHYYTLDLARVTVPQAFIDGTWQYVLNETAEYLAKYGNLRFFSGAVYDQDGDGVRDSDDLIGKSDPSHLFFVLMWCENRALIDHTLCKDIVFVPYILPFKGKNLNCLKPSEYLYDNTARMRDIELLTGMEFFTDRSIWSDAEAIQLRTSLPEIKRST